MSISATTNTANSTVEELSRSLMKNFDTNRDGQFSVDEFAGFLSTFTQSLTSLRATSSSQGQGVGTTSLLTTDGLAGAEAAPAAASRVVGPCMPGWDATKWADPSHSSIKYVAGRILSGYRPSDWLDAGKRQEILDTFKSAGLNPTASGKDCVDFNDGFGPVDIVFAAGEGGKAWQWNPIG